MYQVHLFKFIMIINYFYFVEYLFLEHYLQINFIQYLIYYLVILSHL